MFLGMLLEFCTNRLAERIPSVGPIIELCPDVVYFVGIWMLTAPEPVDSHRAIGIRALTRGVGVLTVTFDVVFAAVSYLPDLHLLAIRVFGIILGSVLFIFTAFHLANLAVRIPDLRLATQARFVATSLAIISILLGGGILYVESDNSIVESIRGNILLIAAAIPVILITFVFAIWHLLILRRFHKLITQEAARTKGTA